MNTEENEKQRERREGVRRLIALTRERERTGFYEPGYDHGPEVLKSGGPRLTLLRWNEQGKREARDHKGNVVPIPEEVLRREEENRQEAERRAKAEPLRLARRLARARARGPHI